MARFTSSRVSLIVVVSWKEDAQRQPGLSQLICATQCSSSSIAKASAYQVLPA